MSYCLNKQFFLPSIEHSVNLMKKLSLLNYEILYSDPINEPYFMVGFCMYYHISCIIYL